MSEKLDNKVIAMTIRRMPCYGEAMQLHAQGQIRSTTEFDMTQPIRGYQDTFMKWLKNPESKEIFRALATQVDTAIAGFNSLMKIRDMSMYPNIAYWGDHFPDNSLPYVRDLFRQKRARGGENTITFGAVVERLNKLMLQGENKGENLGLTEEECLRFTTFDIPGSALLAGSLFHGIEELTTMQHPELLLHPAYKRDIITNGLVEATSAMQKQGLHMNLLLEQVAGKRNLDWVDGYEGFTPEMRRQTMQLMQNELL